MPPARTAHSRSRLLIQRILLRARFKRNRSTNRIAQIDLTVDIVEPRRRIRIFEIRHEDVRPAIERVDDHLPIDRTCDLDAAILQIVGYLRDGPVAIADVLRLRQKVRKLADIDAQLPSLARSEQSL